MFADIFISLRPSCAEPSQGETYTEVPAQGVGAFAGRAAVIHKIEQGRLLRTGGFPGIELRTADFAYSPRSSGRSLIGQELHYFHRILTGKSWRNDLARQETVNKRRQHGRSPDQSFQPDWEYSPTADRAGSAEQFHARM
jgi:hypothetical protein